MHHPDLSIIVVNFNAGACLDRCLQSIEEHAGATDWRAVVVDNGSRDGSERAAEGRDPRVTLVGNTENVGFARAVNQGAALTAGGFLLLLNPDGCLLPGAVDAMRAVMAAHPDCAVVGPTVRDEDGREQGSARGDPDMMTGLFGRSTWLARRFPSLAVARRNVVAGGHAGVGDPGVEVDWVSGSCMLIRRAAFDAVGGFDERYFLFWEDADLCRRCRAAGWRVRYVPGASVAHTVGQSSRTAPSLSIRAFHRSAYLYYRTHSAPSPWNPLRWLAYLLLAARCGLRLGEAAVRGRLRRG